MFYSNDNYMQDLYFYNQTPNNTYMNNPGNNMMGGYINQNCGNSMMPNNMQMNNNVMQNPNGMFMGQNLGIMQLQNLSSLYPSVYRIINPVVSRVVANSNNQVITEDSISNMVDTVYNIVEGQVDIDSGTTTQRNTQMENQTTSNSSSNINSNTSSSNRTSETNRQTTQTTSRNNRNDSLLRDLIRILIIKELLSRNHFQRQYVQTAPFYMNQTPFNMNI